MICGGSCPVENLNGRACLLMATAKAAQDNFAQQASQFREGRILQLEARIAEIQSSIEAAVAQRE